VTCPYCGGDSQVVDSRTSPEGVRRRRLCNECKRRFTTYERVAPPGIKVVKRSGKTEPFDSEKLTRAIGRIARDRPGLGKAQIARMARAIEAQLLDDGVKTIRSTDMVARILDILRDVDRVAHQRLAANYLDEDGQLRIGPRAPGPADAGQLGLFDDEEEQ
jgi:transcriptional repressor NrdR